MDTVFPFGFPFPTAFYLTLYVLTLVLHVLPMNYVLAGSIYVAIAGLWPLRRAVKGETRVDGDADAESGAVDVTAGAAPDAPLTALIRDWLPLVVSAAITAGVAPLLFVQIVYRQHFYTANLLLAWRWLIVIPVLIVAFYLLYLLKSKRLRSWHYVARAATGVAAAACFQFVAFCWTANHLLSIAPEEWTTVYVTGDVTPVLTHVAPRLTLWAGGAFVAMSMIAGWQLFAALRRGALSQAQLEPELTKLAWSAIGGLLIAVASGSAVLALSAGKERELLFGTLALPYVIVAIVAACGQVVLWLLVWRMRRLTLPLLGGISAACLIALASIAAARESFRLAHVDITQLYAAHAGSAEVGGFGAFAAFLVANLLLIGLCVWLVRGRRDVEMRG